MQKIHIHGPWPLQTNTFLLLGNAGHAVIIDPAADAAEYEALLTEHGAQLTHILLTHGHSDHMEAACALRKKHGAQVWLGAGDRNEEREHGFKNLFPLTGGDCDHAYTDGEDITVDDMTFHVIATPGHSPGSVCLLCGDNLFSGDTLFAGDIGRCDLDGGSLDTMMQSLAKLRSAVAGNPAVLPGHGGFSTFESEKINNLYLSRA